MSYFEAKRLREERAGVITDLQTLAKQVKDEGRTYTAEEREQAAKLDTAEQDLRSKIESAELVDKADNLTFDDAEPKTRSITASSSKVITRQDQDRAAAAWLLTQAGQDHKVSERDRQAADKLGVNLRSANLDLNFDQYNDYKLRAQSTTLAEGGQGMHDSLAAGIEKVLVWHGGMTAAGRVLTTDDGGDRHWALYDDSTTQAVKHTENADTTNDAVTFTRVSIPVQTYKSAVFPVSYEILEDSVFPVIDYLSDALGERLSRKLNYELTLGDGTGDINGIANAAADSGINTDSTSAIGWANLVETEHSVDQLYRRSPKAGWMMHDSTFSVLKQTLDGNNRPLYVPAVDVGGVDRILGYPIYINNDVDEMGAAKKVVYFGDWNRYIIRRVNQIQIMRLNERYAEKLAIGLFVYGRFGGNLLTSNAIKYLGT